MITMTVSFVALILGRIRQKERPGPGPATSDRAGRGLRSRLQRARQRHPPPVTRLSNHLRRDIGLAPLPEDKIRW